VWVRAGQLVSDNVRGLFLVGSGPVGSGRARVMEFSYKQPVCYSLGWDRQTAGQTNGSRYRLMLPYGGGWWRGTVVERRSLAGELSLSCARPAADG